MSENNKKLCPHCGDELLIIDDTSLYCAKDDLTFAVSRGKITVDPDQNKAKGKIQQIEETIAEQGLTLNKIIAKLFGTKANEKDFWE